jgi:hypothetical protein
MASTRDWIRSPFACVVASRSWFLSSVRLSALTALGSCRYPTVNLVCLYPPDHSKPETLSVAQDSALGSASIDDAISTGVESRSRR